MRSRTTESLLTIVGLAGIAALGAFLGKNLLEGRGLGARGEDDGAHADRDSVADLVERFARTLPENEAEIMRRRNRARLQDW